MGQALDYLVIVGFSRSGTTSLFNYLSDHPEVSVSKRKELNYFNNIEIKNMRPIGGKNLEPYYLNFFREKKGVKIDATPEYIGNLDSIRVLHETLKDTNYKIVIMVRDRYERLESWFAYGRMKGIIKSKDSLNKILMNDDVNTSVTARELFLRENALNYYSEIIRKVQEIVSDERLIILRSSDLRVDARKIMMALAGLMGISLQFYQNYNFKIYNRSSEKSYIFVIYWIKIKRFLRTIYRPSFLRTFFKGLKGLTNPKVSDLQNTSLDKNILSVDYNNRFRRDQSRLESQFGHLIICYED